MNYEKNMNYLRDCQWRKKGNDRPIDLERSWQWDELSSLLQLQLRPLMQQIIESFLWLCSEEEVKKLTLFKFFVDDINGGKGLVFIVMKDTSHATTLIFSLPLLTLL